MSPSPSPKADETDSRVCEHVQDSGFDAPPQHSPELDAQSCHSSLGGENTKEEGPSLLRKQQQEQPFQGLQQRRLLALLAHAHVEKRALLEELLRLGGPPAIEGAQRAAAEALKLLLAAADTS